ncbi:unnamed protein product [Allacma fusca]|uniref:Uncharacterized protein n=1 Tax=Allacma fusca TaxID=39272 RepID=A0A8J2KH15_9HEXA|nr:unnamed protein product [Allacma fusca]
MTAILFVVSCLILVTGATRNSSHLLHRQTRQQSRCTYTHTFRNVGEWINLRSEGYPNSYYPNLDCRYTITSPKGTVMRLECPEFNLRYGNNCPIDKFFWSRSGDPNFRDWRFACGTTPIKDTSTSNVLTLGFISSQDQPLPNNKFGCKVTVDPATCSQPCGMSGVSNRIVNGVEAQVSEFPHRCAIYSNRMGLFCACAIISEWYAMTAAHCLDEIEPGEQLILDFGDHDVTVTSDAKNVLMNISSFTIHPEYDTKSSNNDIALIRFQKSITFTNNVS